MFIIIIIIIIIGMIGKECKDFYGFLDEVIELYRITTNELFSKKVDRLLYKVNLLPVLYER